MAPYQTAYGPRCEGECVCDSESKERGGMMLREKRKDKRQVQTKFTAPASVVRPGEQFVGVDCGISTPSLDKHQSTEG